MMLMESHELVNQHFTPTLHPGAVTAVLLAMQAYMLCEN